MRPSLLAASLLGALSLLPQRALSQPCGRGRAGGPLPVALPFGPADFGATPAPCSDARLGLDLRGSVLIDTPDFYGALGAEAVLHGVVPVSRRVWLSGTFTAGRYRFVQNATLIATDFGLGPSDVGVHVGLVDRPSWRLSAYARVLLPTETPSQYAARTGVEPGLSVLFQPHRRVSLVGGLSVPVELSVTGSRVLTVWGARASLDALALLGTWFEPGLGFEVRVGNHPSGAFEHLALRASLRFHLGRGTALHLSGSLPLAGEERTNARVALGFLLTL